MNCNKSFECVWYPSWKKREYCTRRCANSTTKNGLKLKGVSKDTSHLKRYQFKKGHKPWNNGLKGYQLEIKHPRVWTDKDRYLLVDWNRENGFLSGDKHPAWKGDHVKYASLHTWINKQKGKASKCSNYNCNGFSKSFDWANLDGRYKRDLDDYIELCRSCHKQYDNGTLNLRLQGNHKRNKQQMIRK